MTRSVDEIELARADRKAALEAKRQEQLAIDLEALDAIEIEQGDSNVTRINLPFTPGLQTLVAVRTPTPAETKRYRFRCKSKHEKDKPDLVGASEELAAEVCLYPKKGPERDALFAARPGLAVQVALIATKLAIGEEETEGKG